MVEPEKYICPLRNAPCTDQCAWADIQYTIETDDKNIPDNIEREVYCAVAVIAGHFLSESGDIDEYLD